MRISDTDRQRAVDELRRHFAAGRIDVDEFTERMEKALQASTLEDLDKLLSDLPMVRIADPVGYTGSGQPIRLGVPSSRGRGTVVGAHSLGRPARVAVTVAVVVGAIILAIASSWVAAIALIVGWLVGVLQGRARGR
jgi:Domain of unknown function (DUF1707)